MDKFFASVQSKDRGSPGMAPKRDDGAVLTRDGAHDAKQLPKGVVLGKDGKPCRSCMSVRDWMAMAKQESGGAASGPSQKTSAGSSTAALASASAATAATAAATTTTDPPSDCPPDVEALGRHTWTFLHTMTAAYPARAAPAQQEDMRRFLGLFARLYPCWVCAEDFATWMQAPGNAPRVEGRAELGRWMCGAHNAVNRKLGKDEFDCARWEERWRDGWRDGSCG